MTGRPTDEEIAELRRLIDGDGPESFSVWQSSLAMAAHRWLPRLLDIVTQDEAALTTAEQVLDAAQIAFRGRDMDTREMQIMQACQIARDAARAILSDPSGERT